MIKKYLLMLIIGNYSLVVPRLVRGIQKRGWIPRTSRGTTGKRIFCNKFSRNGRVVTIIVLFTVSVFASIILLIRDAENHYERPTHFRITTHLPIGNYSRIGLEKLHLMGSGQFSEENLNYVLSHYPKPTYIFDLRQESHGFLNGIAISWYGKNNWANLHKNDKECQNTELHLLNNLTQQKKVTLRQVLQKSNGEIITSKGLMTPVKNVYNEQDLVTRNHIHYVRIPVSDHSIPCAQQVDDFIKLIKTIPSNAWIYFHCKAGKGRTTTFMTMVDMMSNAKQLTFDQILVRQYLIGGQNLLKSKESSKKFAALANDRLHFLQKFYLYCRENKDDFKTGYRHYLSIEPILVESTNP